MNLCIFGSSALIIKIKKISSYKMGICSKLISFMYLKVLQGRRFSISCMEDDWVDILVEIMFIVVDRDVCKIIQRYQNCQEGKRHA